jgi:histidine ammonia-lyase
MLKLAAMKNAVSLIVVAMLLASVIFDILPRLKAWDSYGAKYELSHM